MLRALLGLSCLRGIVVEGGIMCVWVGRSCVVRVLNFTDIKKLRIYKQTGSCYPLSRFVLVLRTSQDSRNPSNYLLFSLSLGVGVAVDIGS